MSIRAFIGTALLIAALIVAGSPTILGAFDQTTSKVVSRKSTHPKAKTDPSGELWRGTERLSSESFPNGTDEAEELETMVVANEVFGETGPTGEQMISPARPGDPAGRLPQGSQRLTIVRPSGEDGSVEETAADDPAAATTP
jgi:hypothetical protein